VLNGTSGRVEVSNAEEAADLTISLDAIRQEPVIDVVEQPPFVKNGTCVRVHWPFHPCIQLESEDRRFLQIAQGFALLNPHLNLKIQTPQGSLAFDATQPDWEKWLPSFPTSPHWYTVEDLGALIAAQITHDQQLERVRTVREFISQFRGFAGSAKQSQVLAVLGLQRAPLSDLAAGGELDLPTIAKLLTALQNASAPVKPAKLGVIGESHWRTRLLASAGSPESFAYSAVSGTCEGLPYVVEAAFCYAPERDSRSLVGGVNWSPTLSGIPFRSLGSEWTLSSLFQEQHCGYDEPVLLALHATIPKVLWQDRAKSVVSLQGPLADDVARVVRSVTKSWDRQRKAEERAASQELRRQAALARNTRVEQSSLVEAIEKVLPEAVDKASGGGRFVFPGRNLFYVVRQLIQEFTDKPLTQAYFDQVLKAWEQKHGLVDQMYRDPRGHLVEPHTRKLVPLGTREVEQYAIPEWLYHTVLFVEKKGFAPMFRDSRLAERYDLAIVSSEGYASDAAKLLLSRVERGAPITILCLHDADPYGKNIARTLRQKTLRSSGVNVIDIGLHLADALEMGLEPETFIRKKALPRQLKLTKLEQEYFEGEPHGWHKGKPTFKCQRVELNALAAQPDLFLAYIERQLERHGCHRKLVPPEAVLMAEAGDQLNLRLEEQIRTSLAQSLHLDAIVERIRSAMAARIPLDQLPSQLETWRSQLLPEAWREHVHAEIARCAAAKREQIEEQVMSELQRAWGIAATGRLGSRKGDNL
jgi:predicted XRE-type DNA-binding protein